MAHHPASEKAIKVRTGIKINGPKDRGVLRIVDVQVFSATDNL